MRLTRWTKLKEIERLEDFNPAKTVSRGSFFGGVQYLFSTYMCPFYPSKFSV